MDMTIQRLTNFNLDLIVSSIGSQIKTLESLQKNIEQAHTVDEYACEAIKEVERNLYWLRKFIINH